jgi:hypothetical protein
MLILNGIFIIINNIIIIITKSIPKICFIVKESGL